jgi:hypothetical protein
MTTARDKIAEIIDRHTGYTVWQDILNEAAEEIIAALSGMIAPLVWDGFNSGPYRIDVYQGGIADLWFCGKALDSDEEHELLMGGYLTLVSIDDLKQEANAHRCAQIMAAFTPTTEPSK